MSEHAHEHSHHITPISTLVKTLLLLGVLMVTTIAWAQIAPSALKDVPPALASLINNLIAMGIAFIKAVAVIMIFMGVKYQSSIVKLYAALGFLWFTLMFIMFADYGTRHWEAVRGWTPGVKQMAMPRADEPYEEGMPPRKDIKIPDEHH
ncbi:MAG: hypothetical protein IT206_02435 [Fimbriimonadaceae bacterium]|nr:hypothetical protein [Fimbriimonadaceae bacterium]